MGNRYSNLIFLKINDNFIGEAFWPSEKDEYRLMLLPSLTTTETFEGKLASAEPVGWQMVFEWRGEFVDRKKKQRLFRFKEIIL